MGTCKIHCLQPERQEAWPTGRDDPGLLQECLPGSTETHKPKPFTNGTGS